MVLQRISAYQQTAQHTAIQRQAVLKRPEQLFPALAAAPVQAAPADRLRLQHRPAQSLLPPNPIALTPPKERSWEDYQRIFQWIEQATGKPTAYQDARSQRAYLQAIQGEKQSYYDTTGFLARIGVENAVTYGRDDRGVHDLLKTIDYTPNSEEVSLPLRIAQKTFYWFFQKFPNTFNRIADLVDKYYFTRKDSKAQSWLNIPVPQPGISPQEPILNPNQVRANYQNTRISQHLSQGQRLSTQALFDRYFAVGSGDLSALFEDDFHMGTPKHDEPHQNYGSYSIARRLGFNHEQAERFATANYDMDLNTTIYGDTDAFPNAKPSRHFNLNKHQPEKGDTRFIWAEKHLNAAVELARRGRFEQAERELGYGLHSIQDAFAHGHIRLASHAITDNIPDGVDYNPVGAYEATLATIGYLKTYVERLQQL